MGRHNLQEAIRNILARSKYIYISSSKRFPKSCLAQRASQLIPNCGRRSKKKSRTRRKVVAGGAGQHGKLENYRGGMKRLVVTTKILGITRIKRRRELRKRKRGVRVIWTGGQRWMLEPYVCASAVYELP